MAFAVFVFFVVVPGRPLIAQGDPTDADLFVASGGRMIRVGALASDGRVTTVPLEVYVARVLAGEGEPRAAEAAQQALAIAIRTYVLANLNRHGRDGFDICDTTHCQVPRAATAATRRAALATAGQILTWRGATAEVFYSASCGGRSEEASQVWPDKHLPYLTSHRDDVHEGDAPWTIEMTLDDIRQALGRAGFAGARLQDVDVASRNESGRVARLHLKGLKPDTIAGDQFRAAVGATALRSTSFSLKRRGIVVEFTGRGFGHGVGMCVIGAGRRALRGESVRAILAQYYPGLELTRLDQTGARAPGPVEAPAAAAAPVAASRGGGAISARVPAASTVSAGELEQVAARAHADLGMRLGTSVAPISIRLHDTIESFRAATDRPWWVSAVVRGTAIDLAPAAVLAQRDGLEAAVRVAVAEMLVSSTLADRPLWVRTGAARYFGSGRQGAAAASPPRLKCPADAELTLAVSVTAQREAESRAEACFARELAKTNDWRTVR